MATLLAFFLKSRIGNVVGLAIVVAIAYGGIYAKGYFAAREAQRTQQLRNNELATQERRAIERAVPRADWDDRVDELR